MTSSDLQSSPRAAAPRAASGSFVRESRQALGRLQDAIRRAVATVPVGGIRPTDLGRAFELDYALAWQVHALANQPEDQLSARAIPKRGAMERFLIALERRAPGDLSSNVRRSYEELERVVAEHADDRDTFDAMLTLQGSEDAAALRRLRRAAHRSNAAVWGLTCRCTLRTAIFNVRPDGECDGLAIFGQVGLQKLHPDAVVSIPAASRVQRELSNAADGILSAQFIEEGCSQPLPRIERTIGPDGTCKEFLEIDALGKRGETTVFWRNELRSIQGGITLPIDASRKCMLPAEVMVVDFLLPRKVVGDDLPVRAWLAPDRDSIAAESAVRSLLPFEGKAQRLGPSLSALHTAAAPQYADLVRSEIARMGWSDTEFIIFRCEVKFPVLHSVVHLLIG